MKTQEQPQRGKVDPAHLYQAYNKARNKEKLYVLITRILLLVVFLGLWEVAGRLKWIDVFLFSYPSKILKLLYDKAIDGSLFPHIGVTVAETIAGFVLGTLSGLILATLIWWSPFLARVLDPYLVVLNSLPKVALGPLFIVALGSGILSIIATILSITVIITTLVIYTAFKEVDPNYVKVVRIFGATRTQSFLKVILPASFPAIISTLKVNVGLAWVGVIVGEFLVAKEGLGYLIIYGFQVFNFTLVISSLFIIAAVATIMYQIVAAIESRIVKKR
ncbi:NitT/TauT family transport system permease protein [Paenibacillus taihuensis]|uniref:NitT/TauT family transport system permease protein n=1 Tax=Paenibacillus taihuensis TaxID=1156355 RepID=A0A3D9R4M7_9BACL|nr:ABC transporter permease [Paenibacillus taihuensis]REE68797.1 NitT/TauT family transport system permease protein [Paenibacillus taihuensis]